MTSLTSGRHVDPSNAEAAKAWDGDEGAYWAAHAEQFDRALGAYHHRFMTAAEIGRDEQVLDIGCGTGQTTRDAARLATSGGALGVDLSTEMIALAQRLAAADGLSNARFEQADAQIHPFTNASFDVAISRTGAMFFGDPVAAFRNIARALRPGGRLMLLSWQEPGPNEWIRALSGALAVGRDLPSPPPEAPGLFALSDPDRIKSILAGAGFTSIELEAHTEPLWFGDDTDDGSQFVLGLLGWMLQGLEEDGRARAHENLRRTLSEHHTDHGILYNSAIWTTRAHRPVGSADQ
jgi:SAM-dependent methyltransferase